MRRLLSILLAYGALCISLLGQEQSLSGETLRHLWQERLNALVEDGRLDETRQKLALESLEQLLSNPLDLNSASAEDLRQIPFLSDFQIYQLIHYRANKRGQKLLRSDLKTIKSWDKATLKLLLPLLKSEDENAESLAPNNQFSEDKTQANLLYARRQQAKDEQYLGSPNFLAFRFSYQQPQKFKLFLGAEQDYCEPWRYGKHRGFDSYSYALSATNVLGLSKLVLGHYRVSWGEGLCLRQGFRMLDYTARSSYANKLQSVAGLSEGNKFRGVGAQWQKQKISLMAFASHRQLDGRIDEDGLVYGLSEAGLHRREQDFERRRQVPMRAWGIQLGLSLKQFDLRLHHLYYDFSKDYRLAHATGASRIEALNALGQHYNTALSYHWHSRKGDVLISGELARNQLGAWAYVQNSSLHLSRLGDFALHLRSVSPHYWAYYAQTNTHFLRPNNERGVTLSFVSRELLKGSEITTYFDSYKGIRAFDNGDERAGKAFGLRLKHRLSKRFKLEERLSWRQNEGEGSRLRLGLRAKHQLSETLAMETGLATSRAKDEWGYLIYQKCRYQIAKKVRLSSSILYHNVPQWSGRIYYYEPQLRYQYQSLFLYRQGFRVGATCRLKLSERCTLGSKFAYHRLKEQPRTNHFFALSLSFR